MPPTAFNPDDSWSRISKLGEEQSDISSPVFHLATAAQVTQGRADLTSDNIEHNRKTSPQPGRVQGPESGGIFFHL